MTLSVNAFTYDENDKMQFVEKDGAEEMAGFEACRYTLYASPLSKKLGLKTLPTLAETDLIVPFEDLEELENEVTLILKNLELYERSGIYDSRYIESRLTNILNAIEDARKINGYVIIW